MQNFNSLKTQFEISAELPIGFPKNVEEEIKRFKKAVGAKKEERFVGATIGRPKSREKRGGCGSVPAITVGAERNHNTQRENFSHLQIICIDPDGARDHDDAISVEETRNGFILGVHIADVSHFVAAGSALDKEAEKRAFTQYLPWGSFPMLPEILSADLCSLVEGEDRYSFSCIITLDKKCRIEKYRFAKGLIKVSRSITYRQAVELLDKKDKDIYLLSKVADLLKKQRTKNGLMEMGSLEYQCQFGKNGEPIKIVPRKGDISNSWIEECMLAANKCCALELQKRKLAGIYRTHEAPDPEDIAELMKSEPSLFFDSPIDPNKLLKDYNTQNTQDKRVFNLYAHLVKKAKDNPLLINKILRSMQKAKYSADPLGHFALHWKDYAHFTSPIRRYADLWCHRELAKAAGKKSGKVKDGYTAELCDGLTESEIKNQKTERKSLKLCASYLLQNQIGQTFNAEVQGIEEFGIFISISNETVALADGLVHLRDIPGDFYVYNQIRGTLVGRRTGRSFKRGDKIKVKLMKVNVLKGENDFMIISGAKQEVNSAPPHRSHPSQGYPKQQKSDQKNPAPKNSKPRRFGRRKP
ncbi:hypothetical protein AGMMS49938_07490 [Fibrobacterales bacterium]|nr:hypothetical protein AGMMS49938_07490 [Fibrobacterales bacterium]